MINETDGRNKCVSTYVSATQIVTLKQKRSYAMRAIEIKGQRQSRRNVKAFLLPVITVQLSITTATGATGHGGCRVAGSA